MCSERPGHHRAADKFDEAAPFHEFSRVQGKASR
jgi:hypothetical protein